MSRTTDQLKAAIEHAFESIRHPGDDDLVKRPEYPEPYALWQAFRGRTWKDISVEEAEYWRMNLPSFTDFGFAYFLPAFLLASLQDEAEEIDAYLIRSLIPPENDMEEFDQRMQIFDNEQRQAIAQYVDYYINENPASSQRFARRTRLYWEI